MRVSVFLPIALCTTFFVGCSKDIEGELHVLRNYGDVVPVKMQSEGESYGILDKPTEGRMIAVSLGPWFDVTNALIERTTRAAAMYLRDTERDCKIDRKRVASGTDGSIEFFYSCRE